ncbi:MAG: hypothetical protein K9I94_00120 [Bacteroidales bacterium]|nr:hypothetical protein [Bacteroidales bacterium]
MIFDDYITLLREVSDNLDASLNYRVASIYRAKEKWINIQGRHQYGVIHFCASRIHNPFSGVYFPFKVDREKTPTVVQAKDTRLRLSVALGKKVIKTGHHNFDKAFAIWGSDQALINYIAGSEGIRQLLLNNRFLGFGIKDATGLFERQDGERVAVLFAETNFWMQDKKLIKQLFDSINQAAAYIFPGKKEEAERQHYLMRMD